jgi:hypothetical protein
MMSRDLVLLLQSPWRITSLEGLWVALPAALFKG